MAAFAEVSDNHKRIEVFFPYSYEKVEGIKAISGARFVPKEKGGPHWSVPLEIATGRALRRLFGDELQLGDALKAWGTRLARQDRELRNLASSETAELERLPLTLPKLYEAMHIGPKGRWMNPEERDEALRGPGSFQLADVKFGAVSPNPLNGNHMGLGKTPETIASIFEAGTDDGPQLIVAPKSALEATWLEELDLWQPHPVYVSTGTKAQKLRVIDDFENEIVYPEFSGWLVVNPDQVRYREDFRPCDLHWELSDVRTPKAKKTMKDCPACEYKLVSEFPVLHSTVWRNVIIDECHENAVRNPNTLTAKGMYALKSSKRFALTGTAMGGKLINLWGLLHFLNPEVFTSKWRWAEQWCGVRSDGYGKIIGDYLRCCDDHYGKETMRPDDCAECSQIEEDFYDMLAPYMIRRTKKEALPWLPPKQYVDVWCGFGSEAHSKQYHEFNDESETIIADESITALGVLAEFTRLKQFASFRHTIVDGNLVPTTDSGKLEAVEQKLRELGIFEEECDEQVVIASQFSQVVDLVHDWLAEKGVAVAKITGAVTKKGERARIKSDFQDGGKLRALVLSTKAGGVSLTLDRANTVFILDETWNPDNQEQVEDRAHRASRLHQVTVYYFRTKASIEEYIMQVTGDKAWNSMSVLDLRRINRPGKARRPAA